MTDQDVLVADIGGTNARFAVARVQGAGAVTLQHIEVRKSADYARMADLIAGYGARLGALPRQACLAIAGPVSDGVGRVTNAGLAADAAELQRELGLARVLVMNDFAALANAVPQLAQDEVSVVKAGEANPGEPISVMGAGTGFGCALLPPCGGRYGLVATEGGHASFSPTDDIELRLWQWLRQHMEHVSVEAVLSGPGLALMHRALREFEGVKESLSPNEICRAAAEDPGSPAGRTLELFCNVFGSVAGDIVLTQGAAGGAYLGGGVLMKNSAALFRSRFAERFTAKGVMTPYLVKIPVFLIRSEYAALKGAALWAAAK